MAPRREGWAMPSRKGMGESAGEKKEEEGRAARRVVRGMRLDGVGVSLPMREGEVVSPPMRERGGGVAVGGGEHEDARGEAGGRRRRCAVGAR